MKPNTSFIIDNNSVIPVVLIEGNWFAPANVIFENRNNIIFDSKLDAQYSLLIQNLEKGKSLDNYKSSKYFKYYCDRLKEEPPEYII